MTSPEENIALTRQFFNEVFNQGNLNAVEKYCHPNCIDHNPPPGAETPEGIEGLRSVIGGFLNAFPDMKVNIEDLVADGDKIVIRSTFTGTHNGEMMGIPPTGKPINVSGIDIHRLENGKITEHWGQFDVMGMMAQLGLAPPSPGQE